jgi:predicted amidohydrolase
MKLRLALVQISPGADKEANIAKASARMEAAARSLP